jgi:nuclear pore complex protein Nup62
LDDLTKSITQMIQAVNELSVSSGAEASSKDDPLTQIAEVLNEHLASLNWIDGAVGEVETRIKDAALRLSNGKDSNTDGSKLKASGYRWNR